MTNGSHPKKTKQDEQKRESAQTRETAGTTTSKDQKKTKQ